MNKAQIIGHIGTDPMMAYKIFNNGGAVCNISVSTSERGYKLKDGTEVSEKVEWHNVVFRNKLAEIAGKYLKKGDKVYIEGKLQTREYEKDGIRRKITEIIVSNFEFMQKSRPADTQQQEQPATRQNQQNGGNVDYSGYTQFSPNDLFEPF